MMDRENLSPALRGKSRSDRLGLIQSIVEAGKRGRFPLGAADCSVLAEFVVALGQEAAVDETLLLAVSRIVRHYEQHLIALTRSVR
jgi:hypothetical protein